MKRNSIHMFVVIIMFAGFAVAQQQTTKKASGAAPKALPAAPSASATAALPSEDTVNAFMHDMMGYDPSITWKIDDIRPSDAAGLAEVTVVVGNAQGSQLNKFYVTADGKHAVMGQIIPFGEHPFADAAQTLNAGLNGPSRGPATAPVTVVEFSDLQCPHCKAAHPILDKLLAEDTNVRLVYQNFPLPGHDWADMAAGYADCIGCKSGPNSNDNFWKFVSAVFDAQSGITAANAAEKLTALADQSGEKGTEIAACAASPDTTARVQHSIALGKSVGVNATPTVFINGRTISSLASVPFDTLKQLVDFAATDGKQ
jgi:protein-disulfide isomerase